MAGEQVRKEQGALPDPARPQPCPTDRSGIHVDYIAFFDPHTLQPVKRVTRGTHLALAVRLGRTRLIDNARLG
jgi:pantothenate synthetase